MPKAKSEFLGRRSEPLSALAWGKLSENFY